MSKQYEFLVCPFCHKGEISCLYFPSAVSIKRNVTASLPGKGSINKSRETWIVQSGCINCGKGKDEVERELRKEGFV